MLMLYLKMLVAAIVGWKLGVLESKIERIIDGLNDQRKKKAPR